MPYKLPSWAATCNGAKPSLFVASTFAPFWIKRSTISLWPCNEIVKFVFVCCENYLKCSNVFKSPLKAAVNIGVHPSLYAAFTLAPFRIKVLRTSL